MRRKFWDGGDVCVGWVEVWCFECWEMLREGEGEVDDGECLPTWEKDRPQWKILKGEGPIVGAVAGDPMLGWRVRG